MSMDNEFYENEFDAFSEGVEPGGLRNRMQIKVLITFMVSRIKEPIRDTMLIDALQTHGLANYFETTQALDELLENGILVMADGYVYITPKGALSVDELARELPKSVKETAVADALKIQLLEKRESENTVDIKKTETGYLVTVRVIHKDEPMMELTVYAADSEQAEQLKHNFLKDPSHVYSTVVASLFV
jgi:hypothetical protein